MKGGPNPPSGGPYLQVDLDPGGPYLLGDLDGGGPYLIVDMDRGSKSTGVQINWDTGKRDEFLLCLYEKISSRLPVSQEIWPPRKFGPPGPNFLGYLAPPGHIS